MSRRGEHFTHDRSRATLRETSRKHYLREHKEQEHEFNDCKLRIEKLMNDGYEFVGSQRESNHYEVYFRHPLHQKQQDVWFNFEVNYRQLSPLWQTDFE